MYEIRLLTNDLQAMRSQQSAAVLSDEVTLMPVAVDLTDLRPGAYVLALRPARAGEEWQTFPLILRSR
jgi:hypothetical protein